MLAFVSACGSVERLTDCVQGQACATNYGAPCILGALECGGSHPLCLDNANAPDGTPCAGSNVCLAGQCRPCTTDPQCGLGYACYAGQCAATVGSCAEVLSVAPLAPSGAYTIATGGAAFRVFCDMVTDGGGWTLVLNASRASRLLVVDQTVTKSVLVTQPTVDTGKVELLDFTTTGASLAWGHLAGQDTLFVAAPTRMAKAPGTAPWTLFDAMDTGFRTFGVGYGGAHSECNSPGGDKIRNLPSSNLDPTKLVMIAGSYDGNIVFMFYGISTSQCFANLTTWDFGDYAGATSDEVVNVFTR